MPESSIELTEAQALVLSAVVSHEPHARWDDIALVSGYSRQKVKGILDDLMDMGMLCDPHWHAGKSCESASPAGRSALAARKEKRARAAAYLNGEGQKVGRER